MDYTFTNITIMLLSSFMLAIILICLLISSDRREQLTRAFITVIVFCMGMLLSDTIAWWIDSKPGLFNRYILIISNFLVYSFSVFCVILLIRYIALSIPVNKKIIKKLMYILWIIAALVHVMIFANMFYGFIYFIDENNKFNWGTVFWMEYIFIFLFYGVITVMVILHRKQLGTKYTIVYLIYVVLPVIFSTVNFFYIDLMIGQTMLAMSLLIIFVNIHVQREKLMKEQELKLKTNSVNVMLSQIQPHFIYNTLVVIRQLCRLDPKLAEETVVEFSDYIRGNLDSLSLNKPIPFEKELAHTETYLKIEKKRFGEKLIIKYDIKTKAFNIPVLSLQPIVENAIRYGITRKELGGTIEIKTDENETGYFITITDDGAGFDMSKKPENNNRSHIGIENTRSRLAAMCSGSLEIQSTPGTGTVAVIRIPK